MVQLLDHARGIGVIARFLIPFRILRSRVAKAVLALMLCALGLGGYFAGLHYYADYHLRAAERAEARFDFDDAADHLSACLWARPKNGFLHLQMARVERRAGRYDRAAEHLEKCQDLDGPDLANALEWGMLQAQAGEIAGVERSLQEKVDQGSPETSQILEALAQGYIHTYRLDGAMYCLDRLLAREPDNVQALLWRATLWQTAGNEWNAEADLRSAVAAQPEHIIARCRLGESLLRHNLAADALQQFEAVRHLPRGDRPEVLLGLAKSHWQLDNTGAARQALDELLAKHPKDGGALRERGKLALETESPASAEVWLRQVVALYPFDAQANYLLAQCLQREGKEDEAREYQAARERIESDLKRLEAVFGQVTKAPHDPAPRLEAGIICLRNGQESEAERWLLSALQQDPQNQKAHTVLADFYEQSGKTDLAADHRRQAARPARTEAPGGRGPH
jgi:Tfp pilus assembly protein PilF